MDLRIHWFVAFFNVYQFNSHLPKVFVSKCVIKYSKIREGVYEHRAEINGELKF